MSLPDATIASKHIVRSKYFPSPSTPHANSSSSVAHATLAAAAAAAATALETYLTTAKVKNAHDAHERAAHEVLMHFRFFVRARMMKKEDDDLDASASASASASDADGRDRGETDGDVDETRRHTSRASDWTVDIGDFALERGDDGAKGRRRGAEAATTTDADADAFGKSSLVGKRRAHAMRARVKREKKEKCERTFEGDDEDAIARAGNVLQNFLQEAHRLHVNASCRVKSRAPEVARARDNLTALRREARDLFRAIDPEGFRRDKERLKMLAGESQAALDISITHFDVPPKTLDEIRNKCPVMASTGSPHHLCAHLCYYREYEPARQMYVLRCRAAESKGSAKALDGWRAELAIRPVEDVPAVNRSRADYRGTASGACSIKHFAWMVEFVAPNGARYRDGMHVLNAVSVECDKLSWPRASHGGSGIREARVSEDGLTDQTELLRAALWEEMFDGEVGTTPVRGCFARVAAGGDARSPLRLAPDPLANDDDDGVDRFNAARKIVGRHDGEGEDSEFEVEKVEDDNEGAMKTPTQLTPRSGDEASTPGSGPEPVRHWWAPPLSPFGLLEEILWQDEWKLLVACMMLNCTTRLQVDRVLWRLFLLAPTAADAVRVGSAPEGLEALERIIAPLGLHRKRTNAFVKLSVDVEAQRSKNGGKIKNVSACHGVGVYAADAHALFVDGVLAGPPRDHALRWYHAWAHERRNARTALRSQLHDA